MVGFGLWRGVWGVVVLGSVELVSRCVELMEAGLDLAYGVGGKGYAHEWKDLGRVMLLLANGLANGLGQPTPSTLAPPSQ